MAAASLIVLPWLFVCRRDFPRHKQQRSLYYVLLYIYIYIYTRTGPPFFFNREFLQLTPARIWTKKNFVGEGIFRSRLTKKVQIGAVLSRTLFRASGLFFEGRTSHWLNTSILGLSEMFSLLPSSHQLTVERKRQDTANIKLSFFDHILTIFWLHFNHILNIFWPHFNYILTIFWPYFKHISTTFWAHFDHILTIFWPHFDHILDRTAHLIEHLNPMTVMFSLLPIAGRRRAQAPRQSKYKAVSSVKLYFTYIVGPRPP